MYLTAQEAAEELGVSLHTLYAYVGRKNIRSQPVEGTKNRLYWREDIEKLKSSASRVTSDPFVPESAITLITPEGPFYRGLSAIDIAETETLEAACSVVWGEGTSGAFDSFSDHLPKLYHQVLRELGDAPAMEKACSLLPILERADSRVHDLSAAGYTRSGAQIMRWFASLIGGTPISADPIHLVLARALHAPKGYDDILRRLLVLSLDHELEPSTYAVRSVATTGVTPYQLVLVGFAASTGRRLAFGRSGTLAQMMAEIFSASDPTEPIRRRLREGEPIHGFSSRVYPQGDPRAASIIAAVRALDPDDPDLKRMDAAIDVVAEAMDKKPDLVIPLTFIAHKLGVPNDAATLLRLARIGGWIAHGMEQYFRDLVRIRTVYTGELPHKIAPSKPAGARGRGRAAKLATATD